jgi:NAD(P)-dependent dehydrogenase (short-subunit alcohol dehydrogenase family)
MRGLTSFQTLIGVKGMVINMGKDMFSLKGYCSVVTGAARGLGKYMSEALALYGSNIVVADIDINIAEKTARELRKNNIEAIAIKMDVRDEGQIDFMVKSVLDVFGKIDVLINNAGICKHVNVENMSYSDWQEVIDINLNGVFKTSRSVGREMIKNSKGSIINISSMSGIIVNTPQNQAAYNVSKAGVIMLTKSLAAEWAKYNIRVNTIAPGYMNIGVAEKFFKEKTDMARKWVSLIPMGRPGEPEELGGIAVYLASNASSYVTGGVFTIDGGYTIY